MSRFTNFRPSSAGPPSLAITEVVIQELTRQDAECLRSYSGAKSCGLPSSLVAFVSALPGVAAQMAPAAPDKPGPPPGGGGPASPAPTLRAGTVCRGRGRLAVSAAAPAAPADPLLAAPPLVRRMQFVGGNARPSVRWRAGRWGRAAAGAAPGQTRRPLSAADARQPLSRRRVLLRADRPGSVYGLCAGRGRRPGAPALALPGRANGEGGRRRRPARPAGGPERQNGQHAHGRPAARQIGDGGRHTPVAVRYAVAARRNGELRAGRLRQGAARDRRGDQPGRAGADAPVSTFVVTSTADDDTPGTLRRAINDANSSPGAPTPSSSTCRAAARTDLPARPAPQRRRGRDHRRHLAARLCRVAPRGNQRRQAGRTAPASPS